MTMTTKPQKDAIREEKQRRKTSGKTRAAYVKKLVHWKFHPPRA